MQLQKPLNLLKGLFTLLLCFFAASSYAQKALTNSRTGSYYTYVYKISDQDLLKIYKTPALQPDDKMLHQPVDFLDKLGIAASSASQRVTQRVNTRFRGGP